MKTEAAVEEENIEKRDLFMVNLKDAALNLRENGITGAHELIFLTRYASLANDRRIASALENALSGGAALKENAFLAFAYGEYYEYSKNELCPAAADFILSRLEENGGDGEHGAALMAYARCAAAFGRLEYLEKAVELAGTISSSAISPTLSGIAFAALGMAEVFRTTLSKDYLHASETLADVLLRNFRILYSPDDSYDIEKPCGNSAAGVLFDMLYGYTGSEKWREARERQCAFISKLAEKYPEPVSFGLCSLLADEFGRTRVLCEVPEGEVPKEVQAVLAVYSPNTYITVDQVPCAGKARFFLLENGEKREITI